MIEVVIFKTTDLPKVCNGIIYQAASERAWFWQRVIRKQRQSGNFDQGVLPITRSFAASIFCLAQKVGAARTMAPELTHEALALISQLYELELYSRLNGHLFAAARYITRLGCSQR